MAKKSRRAGRQGTSAAQPVRINPSFRSTAQAAPKEVEFSKEYHYVIEDLKRIAIIAAVLLILLVVLAILVG